MNTQMNFNLNQLHFVTKTLSFFLFLLLLPKMQVNAQTWFPVGAEWTYTIVYPQSDISFRTIKINCLRDTNIQGIDARILTEGSACSGCKSENIFYYDSTDDIVYQYIIDQFKPYLDFSKGAGETYYLYFYNMDNYPGEFCDSILLEVDSVVTHQILGKNIRYQYIKRVQRFSLF